MESGSEEVVHQKKQVLSSGPSRTQKQPQKEEKKERWWFVWFIVACFVVILAFGIFVLRTRNKEIDFEPWKLKSHIVGNHSVVNHAVSHTITSDERWQVKESLKYHLGVAYLNRYGCLCMHHLQIPSHISNLTYSRICGVLNENQFYIIINPTLIGYWKKDADSPLYVKTRESSIVCNYNEYNRNRYFSAGFDWFDEYNNRHFMYFRDKQSACLELALDEFTGLKTHCSSTV